MRDTYRALLKNTYPPASCLRPVAARRPTVAIPGHLKPVGIRYADQYFIAARHRLLRYRG